MKPVLIVTLLLLNSFSCLIAQEDNESDFIPAWVDGDCTSFWGDKLKERICDVGSYSNTNDIAVLRAGAIEAAKKKVAREMKARVQAVVEHYGKSHHGHKDFGKPPDLNRMKNTSQKITDDAMQLSEINAFWITPQNEVYTLVSMTTAGFDDAVGRMEFLSEELRKELHKRMEQIIEHPLEHVRKSLEKEQKHKWHFELTHYLWAPSIYNKITIGPLSLNSETKFSEIFKSLKYAILLHFEFGINRWTLITDLLYSKEELTETAHRPIGPDFKIDYSMTKLQCEVLGAYQLTHEKSRNKVDVMLGVRYTQQDSDFELAEENLSDPHPLFPFANTTTVVDPLIGARYKIQFHKHWGFYFRTDIGGFTIDSEFTSNMITRISYKPVRFMDIELGCRWIYVNYNNNKNGVYIENKSHEIGPVISIGFKW